MFLSVGKTIKRYIKNGSKNATLPFEKTSDDIITLSRSSKHQTDTINRKLFENASSPVLRISLKSFVSILLGCFQTFWTHCIIIEYNFDFLIST
jgi:hypothetical protein